MRTPVTKADKYLDRVCDILFTKKKPVLGLVGGGELHPDLVVPNNEVAEAYADAGTQHQFHIVNFVQRLITKIIDRTKETTPLLNQVASSWVKDGSLTSGFVAAKNQADMTTIEEELGWQSKHQPNWQRVNSVITDNKLFYPANLKQVLQAYARHIHAVAINNDDRYNRNYKEEIQALMLEGQRFGYDPKEYLGPHVGRNDFVIAVRPVLYHLDKEDATAFLRTVYEDEHGKFKEGVLYAVEPSSRIPPSPIDAFSPSRFAEFAQILKDTGYQLDHADRSILANERFSEARNVFADQMQESAAVSSPPDNFTGD